MQRQLVANGEVLARYGDAPTSEENATQTNNPVYVDTADFRLQAAQIRPRHKSMDPIAYTVVGGETLKDIARNVLGDASLWWRIAEANSLAVSGDGALTAGQTLTVPKLSLNANSVDTFQPYDPSQAMGSMDPVLPVPANGGRCGGIGAIIMVVVAIVVTIYTAGALAAAGSLGSNALGAATLASTTTGGGFAATMAAGAGVLGGGAGIGAGIAAGVAGGAMGSIVSQAVGNAIGAQDGFSWKGVALSALSGGVSGGLAGTSLLGGTTLGVTVARAAASSVLSQGIGVATGLQSSFNWKSVAASAAGAGVGWGMNNALGLTDANGVRIDQPFGLESIGKATLSGFAAGLTTAVARGGRISVQQVATDAFGNVLGEALVDYARNSGTPAQETMPGAQEAFRASEIAYRNATDPVDMGGAYGLQVGRSRYGFGLSRSSLSEWNNEVDGGIMINGSLVPEQAMLGQAVVGKNQGPIAALAAAGLDAAQHQAMYGQMLAKGTIRLNAQGVPPVQPGQVLDFDLSDMSAGKLGASAIGQESRLRSERVAAAAQDNQDARDIRAGFRYQSMLSRGLSESDSLASANIGSRPAQYLSQWDGVTRQAPVVNYLQSTLGGMDPVRGSQWGTQVAKGLPEAALNEAGGLAVAKVLGAGIRTVAELQAVRNAAEPVIERVAKVGTATLAETGAVDRLLYGARVGEGLPGGAGVAVPMRPTPAQLEALTVKHDVEFAVTYKLGPSQNGRGGQYFLYSGEKGAVDVPLQKDMMLIYHTHPGGTPWASPQDMNLMRSLEAIGSPQRSSQIVPVGKDVVRFSKDVTGGK
ncbi:LysM peptidoglycan-binding domain-containing protein [Acidovorax sp. PRC11]|uniref:LysM peptidoglycan-binding domain-containing protein n=1 Tax=Acidovorax sp. PRC11 TaxID=2962592 RepID=UPI002882A9F6|nr:LysM peptidoglycan-binding domain-containing protein [Acidovorax sp. PRC11]MDT0140819.1 LysM peptidoglycan-binding domain-containing protein [Acidovorax sp. PRC11]